MSQHKPRFSCFLQSILLLVGLFSFVQSYGQKEVNNWYFGNYAGITFNTLTPSGITNGQLNTYEGCATISNANGDLLFYTDGIKVWDSTHNVTPNGTGLKGNSSSTQSAVVIPRPGNPGKYYIFTVDAVGGSYGLQYSEFNMALNSGKGDIDTALKNRKLLGYTCEKITAVKHANNTDFWVCTHKFGTDSIYSFLVTSVGINTMPVASATGVKIAGSANSTLGYMKISPDGKKIGYANWTFDTCCIADFNIATGSINNVWSFYVNDAYGIEFSASSKFVYFAEMYTPWNIYQFDAKAISKIDFLNSKNSVDTTGSKPIGALQMGPDKKIYICRQGSQFLDVINAPDSLGLSCRVQKNAIDLKGKICSFGLPTFIQSYFKTDFDFVGNCYGDTAWFAINDSAELDSVHWNFGDVNSGLNNTATGFRTFHMYSDSGHYTVRSVAFKNGLRDTVYTTIEQLLYLGKFNELGTEIFKCFDDTIALSLTKNDQFRYLWSTNSDSFSTQIIDSGIVTVKKYYGAKCFAVDTVKISYYLDNLLPGDVSLGPDRYKCPKDSSYMRFFDATCTKYIWSNGKTNTSYYEPNPGILSIKAYYGGSCYRTDTIAIFNNSIENFTLGTDTFFCANNPIYLGYWDAGYDSYLWNTGSKTPFLSPDSSGIYSLKVKDANGCTQSDTIEVVALDVPKFNLGKDSVFCDRTVNFIIEPQYTLAYSKYKWSSGKTSPTDTINTTGKYWLTISNPCGNKTDTIQYSFLQTPKAKLPNDTFFCNSVAITLDAQNQNNAVKYNWNTNETTQLINVKDTGLFTIIVSNQCGKDSDQIAIKRYFIPTLNLGNDTTICQAFDLGFKIGRNNNLESYDWYELQSQVGIGTLDSITWSNSGIITATIENTCGKASDTITITQLNKPELLLDTVYNFCESIILQLDVETLNNNQQYFWSNSETTPKISINNPGNYWVKTFNYCGEDSVFFKVNLFQKPIVNLGNDTTVCGNFNVLLNAAMNDNTATYLWRSGEITPSIEVTQTGEYQVTVSNFCGSFRDSIKFNFYQIPKPQIGPDTVICNNMIPVIRRVAKTNNNETYLWSNGSTDTLTTFNTPGIHWVEISNPCGVFTDSVAIQLAVSPIVDLGKDTILCGRFLLTLDANNEGMEYQWQPFGETTQRIYADKQIEYGVVVTNEYGCSGEDKFSIGNNCVSQSWFPNSFSPNGDFLNETFKPVLVNFENYGMKIYNRWGELIFETSDFNINWDGTYQGVDCAVGVYFFSCQFITTENNVNQNVKGTVSLIR